MRQDLIVEFGYMYFTTRVIMMYYSTTCSSTMSQKMVHVLFPRRNDEKRRNFLLFSSGKKEGVTPFPKGMALLEVHCVSNAYYFGLKCLEGVQSCVDYPER
jgi:hypothetical protein